MSRRLLLLCAVGLWPAVACGADLDTGDTAANADDDIVADDELRLAADRWQLVPDPTEALEALVIDGGRFAHGGRCDEPAAAMVESTLLELSTGVCDPIVVEQALPAELPFDLVAGRQLVVHLVHDLLRAAPLTEAEASAAVEAAPSAQFAVLIDGRPVWVAERMLPAEAAVMLDSVVLEDDIAAGARVSFVVVNHGSNSYRVLQVGFR